jgi:uncharacterized membrane protein YccC
MVSDRFRLALQTALAMVLAYGIALSMDWDKPMWAGFAVAFCGLGSVGESLNKGALRLLGTLLAVPLALALIGLFPQDRWLFLLTLSLWTGFCAYMMGTTSRWYFWFVAGFSVPLLTVSGGGQPVQSFDVVMLRAQQTLLGVLCFTVVSVLVLPIGSGRGFEAKVAALVSAQRKLARYYLSMLTSAPTGTAGLTPPADLEQTRGEATRVLASLPDLLDAAEMDTYRVWESRKLWRRAVQELAMVNRLLEQIRLNFDELANVDVPQHLPGLAPLASDLDSRLARIEALLQAPDATTELARVGKVASAVEPPFDAAELKLGPSTAGLGHFDRAALALTLRQLAQLAQTVTGLHEGVDAIRGLRRRKDLAAPHPQHNKRLLPDPQRLRGVLRQQTALWLAALLVIYVPDIPLGGVNLILAGGPISMLLAHAPQLRPTTLIPPALSALLLGGILHILVMPQLAGFWALGALLFAMTFWFCWKYHLPSQHIGKSAAIAIFSVVIGVDNEQIYSFLTMANLALGFPMIILVIALTTYFPLSFRPEDRFRTLLQGWLRSAAWLLGALGTDEARARQFRSPWFRWRFAVHRNAVEKLPQQLAAWSRALPPAALGSAKAADVQAVVTAVQAMADRMDALIRTREVPQSPAMARALLEDVRVWRLGVQALFAQLAEAPESANVEDLRRRLDRKLKQVEVRAEQAMADDPDFDAQLDLNENSYRLLGAYRGLSEALVRFAFRARMLDWPRLREARF